MPLLAPLPPAAGLPMLVGLTGKAGLGGSGGGTPPRPGGTDMADAVAAEADAESPLVMLTSDREDKSPLSSPS